jgi:hypothetical protein
MKTKSAPRFDRFVCGKSNDKNPDAPYVTQDTGSFMVKFEYKDEQLAKFDLLIRFKQTSSKETKPSSR